jgi:hypothetical protein
MVQYGSKFTGCPKVNVLIMFCLLRAVAHIRGNNGRMMIIRAKSKKYEEEPTTFALRPP